MLFSSSFSSSSVSSSLSSSLHSTSFTTSVTAPTSKFIVEDDCNNQKERKEEWSSPLLLDLELDDKDVTSTTISLSEEEEEEEGSTSEEKNHQSLRDENEQLKNIINAQVLAIQHLTSKIESLDEKSTELKVENRRIKCTLLEKLLLSNSQSLMIERLKSQQQVELSIKKDDSIHYNTNTTKTKKYRSIIQEEEKVNSEEVREANDNDDDTRVIGNNPSSRYQRLP